MALDPRSIRAPELPAVAWLNTDHPPTIDGLRGYVLAVEFWDFTCINCLRTLPYLRDWHERYFGAGLRILGIHTPEFRLGRQRRHVRSALGRLGIGWPVGLDNDQAIWTAYAIRAWPSLHLVDREGLIRARHTGEQGYPEAERAIRDLLSAGPVLASPLPEPAGILRPADGPGAVCISSTSELQVDSLGNGPASADAAGDFALPARRQDGRFYLEGSWRLLSDGLTLESERGSITLPFHAGAVHAVLAPGPDPEVPTAQPIRVEAFLDDHPVRAEQLGRDLALRSAASTFLVDQPRAYDILDTLDPGPHELRLVGSGPGLTFYAFSFDACLAADDAPRSFPC